MQILLTLRKKMILVYSTARYDNRRSNKETSDIPMEMVKKLLKWVAKHKQFGAYAEVIEVKKDQYSVDIYCPKIYVDKLSNRAIKP